MAESSMQQLIDNPLICTEILKNISSSKAKARLQRVCKAFRTGVRSRPAWSRQKTISLFDIDEQTNEFDSILLNGERIKIKHLPSALTDILSWIELEHLNLASCYNEMVYEVLLARLISADRKTSVRSLTISGRGRDTVILPYLLAFQHSLTSLHIGHCIYSSRARVVAFWQAIKDCTKLTDFRHLIYRSHTDSVSLEDDIIEALAGKNLCSLHLLGLRNLSPQGIVTILNSLPAGCLKKLALSYANIPLRTLQDLNCAHRESLSSFHFGPFPIDGADDIVTCVPMLFPNLKWVTLEAQVLTFPSTTVVETIDKFLRHREIANNTQPVWLSMSIFHQHTEVLEKVLGRLVREKGCSVTPFRHSGAKTGYKFQRNDALVYFCNGPNDHIFWQRDPIETP